MQPRTKRQKEVLDYIVRFVERNGYGPSYQRIAHQLGVSSKGGVQRHIIALENQGLIARRRKNGSFGIELSLRTIADNSVCAVELVAISEVESEGTAYTESMTTVPKLMIGSLMPHEVLVFKMPNDSMYEKHIAEGDLVLLEKRSYARRGDIVLVLHDKKRLLFGQFYPQGPQSEIRPANSDFEPFFYQSDEAIVQGVIRGMMRPIPGFEE